MHYRVGYAMNRYTYTTHFTSNIQPTQGVPMSESTEFTAITLYLDKSELEALFEAEFFGMVSQEVAAHILTRLLAELPERPPVLSEGMEYTYGPSKHTYSIVRVGDEEAVIRRVNGNRAGPKGSVTVEKVAKIQADLLSGDAVVTEGS